MFPPVVAAAAAAAAILEAAAAGSLLAADEALEVCVCTRLEDAGSKVPPAKETLGAEDAGVKEAMAAVSAIMLGGKVGESRELDTTCEANPREAAAAAAAAAAADEIVRPFLDAEVLVVALSFFLPLLFFFLPFFLEEDEAGNVWSGSEDESSSSLVPMPDPSSSMSADISLLPSMKRCDVLLSGRPPAAALAS